VSDCCLMPNEQYFSYIMARTSYIQWIDDDVRFVLDQYAELNLYSSGSLKQQSTGGHLCRHITPFGHINYPDFNQSLPLLLNAVFLAVKQQIPIWLSLVCPRTHDLSHSMWFYQSCHWLCLLKVKNYTVIIFLTYFFMPPRRRIGGILIYPCPSGYRYMVCSAISSYSFGATALIFCRMFIHIMEVCMSTGFWFSSNILKMTGSWT
jgi:hypothetical protein